jgi:hypothetical protein
MKLECGLCLCKKHQINPRKYECLFSNSCCGCYYVFCYKTLFHRNLNIFDNIDYLREIKYRKHPDQNRCLECLTDHNLKKGFKNKNFKMIQSDCVIITNSK